MSIKAVFGRYSAAYLIRDGVPIRCDVRDHSGASVLAAGTTGVAPTVTQAATISGTTAATGALTLAEGAASGNPAPTGSIQWYRNGTAISGATGTTLDKAATGTGSYYAVVTWTNSAGSVTSQSNTIAVVAANTAPAQVAGLIANVQGQDVELIWDAPANGGAAITDYEVVTAASTVTDPAQATALSDTVGDTSTSRNLANIPYSTTRNWWVRAVNSVGAGPWSARSSYTIGADPNAAWNALKAAAYFAIDGTETITYRTDDPTAINTIKAAGTGALTLTATGSVPRIRKTAAGYQFDNSGYLAITGIAPDAAKGMVLIVEMTANVVGGTGRGIYYSDSASSGDAEVRTGSGFYQVASVSDSKRDERFQSDARSRVTRRMWAISTHASALSMDFSQSFAKRRQRPSHAKVRSTTHLCGSTSKPWAMSERLTICIVQRPRLTRAPRSFGPA